VAAAVVIEDALQHRYDELHRRVVVVQELHPEHRRAGRGLATVERRHDLALAEAVADVAEGVEPRHSLIAQEFGDRLRRCRHEYGRQNVRAVDRLVLSDALHV
jgi:hypothetical protein